MYYKPAIERYPLQTYMSALLFAPRQSIVRNLYPYEEPKEIEIVSPVAEKWKTCLQTLEGHSGLVWSVVFSHDSTRLASASDDRTIKMWDLGNGDCLQTLNDDHVDDLPVSFSQQSMDEGMREDTQQPQISVDRSIAISQDRYWMTRNSQKRLWLPSEYRPSTYNVSKEIVGIGTGSGRVWICRFRAAG